MNEPYIDNSSNRYAQNIILKLMVFLIGGLQVFHIYLTYTQRSKKITYLLPPKINSKITFIGDKPDAGYIKQFTRYVKELRFNYTPSNVREHFEELLTMYDPDLYPSAQTKYYDLADLIELTGNITSSFYIVPGSEGIKITKSQIEIKGYEKIRQDEKLIPGGDIMKIYLINYKISDGRFYILKIKEKEGN